MDEEGADFGGIARGVEQGIFASRVLIASVESLALAPAAAGDDYGIGLRNIFCDEIGAVGDERAVDAVYGLQGAFDLGGRVVVGLESADGRFDDFPQAGNVGGYGFSDLHTHPLSIHFCHRERRFFRRRVYATGWECIDPSRQRTPLRMTSFLSEPIQRCNILAP